MTQSVTVLTRSHLYRNHVHVRCERNFEASRRSMTPGIRCFANMPSKEKEIKHYAKEKKERKQIHSSHFCSILFETTAVEGIQAALRILSRDLVRGDGPEGVDACR